MKGQKASMLRPVVLLLVSSLFGMTAAAQVSPSATRLLTLSGYGTVTVVTPELSHGSRYGGTLGAIVEHNRWMALDARAVAIVRGAPVHTYIAEAGPRVSRRYGRLEPFAEALAGLGHSEFGPKGSSLGGKGTGVNFTLDGGLDMHLWRHLDWRVGEYTFSHIYVGPGITPNLLSSGAVYRF